VRLNGKGTDFEGRRSLGAKQAHKSSVPERAFWRKLFCISTPSSECPCSVRAALVRIVYFLVDRLRLFLFAEIRSQFVGMFVGAQTADP
jgi:hypothetical protein